MINEYNEDGVQPSRSRITANVALTVLGLALVWLVVTKTYASYLAPHDPATALALNSHEPVALVTAARQALRPPRPEATDPSSPPEAETKGRLPTIADIARDAVSVAPKSIPSVAPEKLKAAKDYALQALRADPANARAFSILGQTALLEQDAAKATSLMLTARRLTPREWPAVLWLMETSTSKGNHADAMAYADTLLRTRAEIIKVVVPLLARAAENKASNPALKELLATNPPWRQRFFSVLSNSITDARTPLDLLLHLKDTKSPPDAGELRPYLDFLMYRKAYDTAYYTWLQFLPPDELAKTGTLYNGSFETKPTGLPFDWRIQSGNGVSVSLEKRGDNDPGRALSFNFSQGRAVLQPVTQSLLLSPGSYDFSVQWKGKINSTRGLIWRIACLHKATQPFGESAIINGVAKDWSTLNFKFQVSDDCPAQQLKLESASRSASEQFVSGAAQFDDVTITPVAPAAAAPATALPTAPAPAPETAPAVAPTSGATPVPAVQAPTVSAPTPPKQP